MTHLPLIIALAATVCVGCESVDSDNILTSGMSANIRATSTGDGQTTIRATLYLEEPGSLDYIELEGDDVLTAYAPDGAVQIMSESQFAGATRYTAEFDADDGGSEFIVALTRTVDDGAPDSRVTLPAQFDIAPLASSTYSRAEDSIDIQWSPASSGDDVDIEVSGPCIRPTLIAVDNDPGAYTVAAGTLEQREGDNVADACEITITVTRSTPGQLDPGYGYGGSISGEQIRSLSVSSTL